MQRKYYGLSILLASAFFYASYGVFSKIIGGAFAPFTQAWTRGIITLCCFLAFGIYKKIFVKVSKEDIKWYIVVGVIGSLAVAPTFYSLANLNIGTALFIQYAATVITSYILGSLFLKEKITKTSIISFGLAFVGLFLVYMGDIYFNIEKLVPVIAAFVSGSFFSIWFVFSKKISTKYPTVQINTYGYVFAVVINFFIASLLAEPLNKNLTSTAWLANIGYGIVGFAGSGLSVYGFKFMEAHKGSIVLLSEILFGMLFGLILFQEVLNPTTLMGGILIIVSIALPNVYAMYSKNNIRKNNTSTSP